MTTRADVMHVLLIEDNPGDVRLIREALEENGRVSIEVALDGPSAVEAIEADHALDLVLVDINIPGTSGLELVSRIRSSVNGRQVPVVMFTSSNLVEDVREAERRGADMFVVKPFDVLEYFSILRQVGDRYLVRKADG